MTITENEHNKERDFLDRIEYLKDCLVKIQNMEDILFGMRSKDVNIDMDIFKGIKEDIRQRLYHNRHDLCVLRGE